MQSDPAGRLIISGQPQQLDNPWGVTPFKKVCSQNRDYIFRVRVKMNFCFSVSVSSS